MKQASEFTKEIDRITNVEKAIVVVVTMILFLIFAIVTHDKELKSEAGSRVEQTEDEQR